MGTPRIIPKQEHGASTDTLSKIKLDSIEEALWKFEIVKDRLMDVSKWHELSGDILARFQLIDATGTEISGRAKEGDYIRINIPGPGNKSGKGYDWVRIEKIKSISDEAESLEFVAIKVRPCPSPVNEEMLPSLFHLIQTRCKPFRIYITIIRRSYLAQIIPDTVAFFVPFQ
ncbi:MAG: hypothetical protein WBJ10_11180 [Daejeonella sp.]|uniref:hypothetical protein n=1 Tax=Daejeonella sp. TaxID=2805397 RepID=UPI003C7539A7